MIRRVLVAIVTVAALAVVGIGLPLAVTVDRLYRNEADTRLEREATAATIEVPAGFRTSSDRPVFPTNEDHVVYALYLPSGKRVQGDGPLQADSTVRDAVGNHVSAGHRMGWTVVAVPVTSQERVIGIVRAAQPQSLVVSRIRRTWFAMGMLGLAVVALSTILAIALARHLSRPVTRLAESVTRLGQGDFAARTVRSGIPELDRAAAALDDTADRLGRVLARERAFSADASHQLRTPLTRLRVGLEVAQSTPGADLGDAIDRALLDADRIETTIDDLLRLAHDSNLERGPIDFAAVVQQAASEWRPRFATIGRDLRTSVERGLPKAAASEPAVRQIVDVLIGNAVTHGQGTVVVGVRAAVGGVAVEVADEGAGVEGDAEAIFGRRVSGRDGGTGIGLALARSLAEAEGGDLRLRAAGRRPVFALTLPTTAAVLPNHPSRLTGTGRAADRGPSASPVPDPPAVAPLATHRAADT